MAPNKLNRWSAMILRRAMRALEAAGEYPDARLILDGHPPEVVALVLGEVTQ
jgi:hypothetical protein